LRLRGAEPVSAGSRKAVRVIAASDAETGAKLEADGRRTSLIGESFKVAASG
jgi:hypothetical protein